MRRLSICLLSLLVLVPYALGQGSQSGNLTGTDGCGPVEAKREGLRLSASCHAGERHPEKRRDEGSAPPIASSNRADPSLRSG